MPVKRMPALLLALLLCLPAAVFGQDNALRIRAFKAGKADAFLLRYEGHAVLIDTAEADDAADILAYLQAQSVTKLDALILTHFDKGHAGGAPAVLASMPVERVLMPDYERDSASLRALNAALAQSGVPAERLTADTAVPLGSLTLHLHTARERRYREDEDNDFSLVTSLRHGELRFLFTADILTQRIGEMLDSNADWRTDVLQVPHHGGYGGATEALLRAAAPGYALITCSDKNPPSAAVLALLQQMGTQTYQTRYGDIDLASDGRVLTITQ